MRFRNMFAIFGLVASIREQNRFIPTTLFGSMEQQQETTNNNDLHVLSAIDHFCQNNGFDVV